MRAGIEVQTTQKNSREHGLTQHEWCRQEKLFLALIPLLSLDCGWQIFFLSPMKTLKGSRSYAAGERRKS